MRSGMEDCCSNEEVKAMFQRLYQKDEILFSSVTEIREILQYMQTVNVFLCQENIRMGHRISKLEQAQPIAKGAAAPVASSSKKEEIHPPISAAISGTIPPIIVIVARM